MNDEGNVVVEASTQEPTNVNPSVNSSSNISGDEVTVINNITTPEQQEGSNNQITKPIGETSGLDIMATEPTVPLGEPEATAPVAPTPLIGSTLNDVQVIEMMDQQARSSIYSDEELIKAGYSSELFTAIAYNESKNRALAIDEYHIKLNKAYKEAENTGWFITPEDSDMVTQMNMAKLS